MLSKLPQARQCYLDWQAYFRQQVSIMKQVHWKRFVASCTGSMTYKAFSYTKPPSSAEVLPLYRGDKSLATHKPEQAALLFNGTSIARTEADLSDIPTSSSDSHVNPELDPPPPITIFELERTVRTLPNKKAKGPDGIANELIKLALPSISDYLVRIFNTCLKLAYFPKMWKTATTVILRKQDKPDYSDPGAYRPIALLSCLGKVLETIISRRLTYWAEKANVIAPGHMGGRRFRSTEDAGISLVTWIKIKWRRGLIVTGLFLDVKSAFPSVHTKRLWYTLKTKGCQCTYEKSSWTSSPTEPPG